MTGTICAEILLAVLIRSAEMFLIPKKGRLRFDLVFLFAFALSTDAIVAHFNWPWYSISPAQPEDNRDALVATAGVAAVVWTGGLVAFSIYRQFSAGLAVAVGMVQLAFVGPLVGLVAHGALLRTIAYVAAVLYGLWGAVGFRMFYVFRRGVTVTAKPTEEKDATDPLRLAEAEELRADIEGLIMRVRANRYYLVASLCLICVWWFNSATMIAGASIVLLIAGLIATHTALFYPPSKSRTLTVEGRAGDPSSPKTEPDHQIALSGSERRRPKPT